MDEPPRYRQSSRKFARSQRRIMTKAETMLWRAVRDHRIDAYGFRRQMPIGAYFADFVRLERKIIVGADGQTHETADAEVRDAARDEGLRRAGFRVLRFPDALIIGGLPIVVERIRAALREEARQSPFEKSLLESGRVRPNGCGRQDPSFAGRRRRSPTPHPALRAAFPGEAGEGFRGRFSARHQGVVAGVVTTLDVGGALAFRAQGDPKGRAFGASVGELDSLRTDPDNPHAVRLYGDMSPADIREAASIVTRVPDAAIRRVLLANGGSAALADTMIARKADMAARVG
nr:endonuclease domain-containing protein [Roseiarcus fermentans]